MRSQLRYLVLTVLLLLAITMVGCQFEPAEPKNPSDSLLVGKLILNMEGFDSTEDMLRQSVNGNQTGNIDMTFTNEDTKKKIFNNDGQAGLFLYF
jgi:hypothetical protein